MELVTVIMSVYREADEYLSESIESILGQTYSEIEFIVILDDPENERAKNLIRKYAENDPRIKFYINERNMGLVKSLNRALEFASGKYIARMDADDISLPTRIENEVRVLEEQKVDFVMSAIVFIDEFGKRTGVQRVGKKDIDQHAFSELIKYGNISTHPTWLLKKEVYSILGGYRNIDACEDYDFVLRCCQRGIGCYKIKEPLLLYRVRSEGISQSNLYKQSVTAVVIRRMVKSGININNATVEDIRNQIKAFESNGVIPLEKSIYELRNAYKKKKVLHLVYSSIKGLSGGKNFRQYLMDFVSFSWKQLSA